MKVVFKDLKHGEIKLIAENLDDIWHLYNIIEPKDLVRAISFRTDEQKDDKIRSKKTEKKKMKLGIRVEEIKFHEFSDRLRIHGKIEEGPQDLGSFHTLNIDAEKMDPLSIIKCEWKDYQLQRIEEAVKLRNTAFITFVSLDEDCATIALLRQSGVQKITDVNSHRSGKMFESKDTRSEYFGDILSILKTHKSKESVLVVVGPGFTKEHFAKFGREKNPELFKNCHIHGTGEAEMNGINEAIKTGIIKQITKENRVVLETSYIEDFFEEIKKDGLATYGINEVKNAIVNGAVDRLLITDKLIRTLEGEEILKLAKKNNSEFTIINTMHEAGKKIEGIGGLAALLRYKI
jgi:protein pelota